MPNNPPNNAKNKNVKEAFIQELRQTLDKLSIPVSNICIVGSGILTTISQNANPRDIDIILIDSERKRLNLTGLATKLSPNIELVRKGWASHLGLSDEQIINNPYLHHIKDGIKFAKPEILLCIYQSKTRHKDRRKLELIKKQYQNIWNWDWALTRECLLQAERLRHQATSNRNNNHAIRKLKTLITEPHKSIPKLTKKIFLLTLYKTKNLILSISPKNKFILCSNKQEQYIPCPDANVRAQSILTIPTGSLLALQYQNGAFQRHDIILRSLAAKGIHEESFLFKDIYHKMQISRTGNCDYEGFVNLVKSISTHGLSPEYPIPISEEGVILDGAHRMACAIYFNFPYVHTRVFKSRKKIYYGKEWFSSRDFPKYIIDQIDDTLNKALEQTGVLYPIILWPNAKPFHDEISQLIKQDYTVHNEISLDLKDNFSSFVRNIYDIDDIDQWKIDLKLHCMQEAGTTIHILLIELPHTTYRNKSIELNGSYLSEEGELIKKRIRNMYKDKIDGYIYDIICHTGDNHIHNRKIFSVIKKYSKSAT
jgi:hypothetical protein